MVQNLLEQLNPNDVFIEVTRLFVMLLLVIITFGMIRLQRIFPMVILLGVYSFLMALFFILLDAVDVAFTEAAVGAGLSTVLAMSAMSLIQKDAKPTKKGDAFFAFVIVSLMGAGLVYASFDMPHYGYVGSPANKGIGMQYIQLTKDNIAIPNIVTAILASFRGYDTMGEVLVVFAAGIAVASLIGRPNNWGVTTSVVKNLTNNSGGNVPKISTQEIVENKNQKPQAKKLARKSSKKTNKKVTKIITQKATKKTAKKTTKKIAKKNSKKTTKKATKNVN